MDKCITIDDKAEGGTIKTKNKVGTDMFRYYHIASPLSRIFSMRTFRAIRYEIVYTSNFAAAHHTYQHWRQLIAWWQCVP